MAGGAPTDTDLYGHRALKYLPLPETSRYKPQYDEQLLGFNELFRIAAESRNPPISLTPATLPCTYCAACETTWLEGFKGLKSAEKHPSHNTLFHADSWQSRRSMVVGVYGACSDDGAPPGQSSFGVYFGPGSSYNLSSLANTPNPTKQTAEIVAAGAAVHHIRRTVGPRREEIVRANGGIHLDDLWPIGWTTPRLERHRNNWIFKLIIITDSIYLVECLCKYRTGWHVEADSFYGNSSGAPLLNGALLFKLLKEIDLLSRYGVDVM